MPSYIFLDNWVLSDFTDEDWKDQLSQFIHRNNFTILINGLSATEIYNPGWKDAGESERTIRIANFLSQHPCVIVNPQNVFRAEFENYPEKLACAPVELSLDALASSHREPALLNIFRAEKMLLESGVDIRKWAEHYSILKSTWLKDAEAIIENACEKGTLKRNNRGEFIDLNASKEEFLNTLDRRIFSLFSSEEREALGTKIVDLFMGATKELPAVRFSSLCFWCAYIENDKSFQMKRNGSDIGDFYQMSLIPYCSVFTVDNTMNRLLGRVMSEVKSECRIYNRDGLTQAL